jgi:glycerol uptake facilitator protein
MFVGELLGTMILILLGNGVVANVVLSKTKGNNGGWIVITAGWCFAVMAGVFVAQATGSGEADLNPAVTLAKMLRGTSVNDGLLRMAGEMVGAFLGAVLVFLAYYQHFAAHPDAGGKLAVHSTGPAIRNSVWNLITEIIGTFVALVWGIGLSLGGPTGYAINPARDLGPRIAHAILPIPGKGSSDWGYAWIPVVGPLVGGLIAALLANALLM